MCPACTQTSHRQDEGTEACLDAIEAVEASHIPRNVLPQLFEIVLKCTFDGQIYKQVQGTAMGTKIAPSYANLFMDRFERAFLAQEPIQPLVWKRYIDDILCIWTGTRSELESFLDRLNKAHRTLKFTWSISDERIEFLDLSIFKGGRFNTINKLDMSTHFKETIPALFLFPPQGCLQGTGERRSFQVLTFQYRCTHIFHPT